MNNRSIDERLNNNNNDVPHLMGVTNNKMKCTNNTNDNNKHQPNYNVIIDTIKVRYEGCWMGG